MRCFFSDTPLHTHPSAFFLRVDRPATNPPTPSGQPKPLALAQKQGVEDDAYYAWFYDGSPLYTILGGVAMVAVMLAGVMFPLWPAKLRIGTWYLSVAALGFIGFMIILAIVRLIFWALTVFTRPRAIWLFPNLFEDVGFVSVPGGYPLTPVRLVRPGLGIRRAKEEAGQAQGA